MSETIEKDELDALLWRIISTIAIKMAEGNEVCPERFMGMLAMVDILKNAFDLSIKMEGYEDLLNEMSADETNIQ